jgi:hypothetical protein
MEEIYKKGFAMHNVQYLTYAEDVDKKKVQLDGDRIAREEDWQEGCNGLGGTIQWIDQVVDSSNKAVDFLDKRASGRWYPQLAVKFKKPDRDVLKNNKKLQGLYAKRIEASKRFSELDTAAHFANAKAAFISCPNCQSKISHSFLSGNHCPVCRADMRPASKKDQIQKAKEKVESLDKLIETTEEKIAKKHGKTMWMVRIEYHT